MLPSSVHVCHAYAFCGWFPYMVTFHTDPTKLDRFTALDSTSQPGWAVRGTRLYFSPNTTIEAVCLSQTSIDERATRVTGTISPVCDQYVQYLLAGANSSVLNRHRRGYNLAGASLPTPLPDHPNRRYYAFHLMVPPGLRLSNINTRL
jgi:hypothetical protein